MYKIQPIRVAKHENLKFCAPIKINNQKQKGLSNFENPVFDFSVLYKNLWIKQENKSIHIGYSDKAVILTGYLDKALN